MAHIFNTYAPDSKTYNIPATGDSTVINPFEQTFTKRGYTESVVNGLGNRFSYQNLIGELRDDITSHLRKALSDMTAYTDQSSRSKKAATAFLDAFNAEQQAIITDLFIDHVMNSPANQDFALTVETFGFKASALKVLPGKIGSAASSFSAALTRFDSELKAQGFEDGFSASFVGTALGTVSQVISIYNFFKTFKKGGNPVLEAKTLMFLTSNIQGLLSFCIEKTVRIGYGISNMISLKGEASLAEMIDASTGNDLTELISKSNSFIARLLGGGDPAGFKTVEIMEIGDDAEGAEELVVSGMEEVPGDLNFAQKALTFTVRSIPKALGGLFAVGGAAFAIYSLVHDIDDHKDAYTIFQGSFLMVTSVTGAVSVLADWFVSSEMPVVISTVVTGGADAGFETAAAIGGAVLSGLETVADASVILAPLGALAAIGFALVDIFYHPKPPDPQKDFDLKVAYNTDPKKNYFKYYGFSPFDYVSGTGTGTHKNARKAHQIKSAKPQSLAFQLSSEFTATNTKAPNLLSLDSKAVTLSAGGSASALWLNVDWPSYTFSLLGVPTSNATLKPAILRATVQNKAPELTTAPYAGGSDDSEFTGFEIPHQKWNVFPLGTPGDYEKHYYDKDSAPYEPTPVFGLTFDWKLNVDGRTIDQRYTIQADVSNDDTSSVELANASLTPSKKGKDKTVPPYMASSFTVRKEWTAQNPQTSLAKVSYPNQGYINLFFTGDQTSPTVEPPGVRATWSLTFDKENATMAEYIHINKDTGRIALVAPLPESLASRPCSGTVEATPVHGGAPLKTKVVLQLNYPDRAQMVYPFQVGVQGKRLTSYGNFISLTRNTPAGGSIKPVSIGNLGMYGTSFTIATPATAVSCVLFHTYFSLDQNTGTITQKDPWAEAAGTTSSVTIKIKTSSDAVEFLPVTFGSASS